MALWTTERVATELAVSADWVREHAAELGGMRTSDSPRAPLRFEPADIEAWKRRRRMEAPALPKTPQQPGPRAAPRGVKLLPLPVGQ